jgi:hypothetical protein
MSNPWIVDPTAEGAEKTIERSYVGPDGVERKIWIKVKSMLSIGEKRRMLKSISSVSQPMGVQDADAKGAEAKFEWTDYSFARMVAYITDWSLAHEQVAEHRLAPTRASYEKLREDVFELLDTALDEHEKKGNEEKKVVASERKRRAISA